MVLIKSLNIINRGFMRYLVLRIIFKSLTESKLPELKGSTLRGAFGRALHDLFCNSNGHSDCHDCRRSGDCAFYYMFYAEQAHTSSAKDPPRPYIFRSENRICRFSAGDLLQAEIVLFGNFIDWVAVVCQAMELAAYRGFGVSRQRYALTKTIIIGPGGKEFSAQDKVTEAMCFKISPPCLDGSENRKNAFFEAITPVNVDKKTYPGFFDAEFFLNSFIRRISNLSRYWGDNDWSDFPFNDYFTRLKPCKILSNSMQNFQTRRYSLTQSREFPIKGFIGNFSISEVPVSLMELLTHLENIHIGKGTAWGMGHVRTVGFF